MQTVSLLQVGFGEEIDDAPIEIQGLRILIFIAGRVPCELQAAACLGRKRGLLAMVGEFPVMPVCLGAK